MKMMDTQKMILKVYESVNPERIRQQMKKLNKKPMEDEKQRAVIWILQI